MGLKTEKTSLFGTWIAIVLPVIYLSVVSLIALTSAGATKSDPYVYVKSQSMYMGIALCAGLFAAFIDLNTAKKFALPIAIIAVIALVLVLVPHVGQMRNGARRWISLGVVDLQVSDMAKIALVLFMASFLHDRQRKIKSLMDGIVKPVAVMGIFCGLIILEPDFGTTALCGIVALIMIFFSGAKLRYLITPMFLVSAGFAVLIYFSPVRRARILSFLDVEGTKATGSYQLYQGLVAFGSGGVTGVGIGQGRQHLSYLPEAHTDFILSIIAEELGLFFTLGVVASFFSIFIAALFSLRKAPNMFQFLLAAGAAMMICVQAAMNLFVVTGMMPTKGISLPFVSYGGSNLVAMFVFAGILVNCARTWNKKTSIEASEL